MAVTAQTLIHGRMTCLLFYLADLTGMFPEHNKHTYKPEQQFVYAKPEFYKKKNYGALSCFNKSIIFSSQERLLEVTFVPQPCWRDLGTGSEGGKKLFVYLFGF